MTLLVTALVAFFLFYAVHMRRERVSALRMPFWMSMGLFVPWVTGLLYVALQILEGVKG